MNRPVALRLAVIIALLTTAALYLSLARRQPPMKTPSLPTMEKAGGKTTTPVGTVIAPTSTPPHPPGKAEEPGSLASTTISGHVIVKSDVQTIPDAPASLGSVLAIPFDDFESLLADADILRWNGNLHTVALRLSEQAIREHIESSIALRPDGSYLLNVDPGKYLVCVANLDNTEREPFPINIHGCVEAVTGESKLNIYVTLGGVSR